MEWHRWSELGRWRELLVGGTNWVEGTKPKTIQSQDPSQKLWEFGECRSHEKSSPHPWLKQEATPSSYYKRMNSDPVTQWPSECVCVCVYVCVFVCLCVCVFVSVCASWVWSCCKLQQCGYQSSKSAQLEFESAKLHPQLFGNPTPHCWYCYIPCIHNPWFLYL